MTKELIALLAGIEIGRIRQDQRGALSFRYEDVWQEADDSYPLSLSMPLAGKDHAPVVVEPFLWGLLPDNEFVLERWARKYQVSARNPFALLSHVGEDCAGNADELLASLRTTAQRLPDELHRVCARVHEEGLNLAIVERLANRLIERARACERMLEHVKDG